MKQKIDMEHEESLLDILVEGFKKNTRLVGELFPQDPSEESVIYIEEGRYYYEIEIEEQYGRSTQSSRGIK